MYSARNNQLFNEILMAQKNYNVFHASYISTISSGIFFMYNYREKKKIRSPPPLQSKIAEIGTGS